MAYDPAVSQPTLSSQSIAANGIWIYVSADVSTDVDASDYFTNGKALGMKVGDIVHVIESDNSYLHTVHSVTVVDADGNVTVSAAT